MVTGDRLQALPRSGRKIAILREDMPSGKVARIAGNRMLPEHADLDALMDDSTTT